MNSPAKSLPSLRVNVSWIFLGNVIYSLTQWGMLIAIAKLGSPVLVGQFTLGLALTAPIVMLTNMQLRTVQATDIKDEYTFSDFLGFRIISILFFMIIMVFIIFVMGYNFETAAVILALTIAKMIEGLSDITYGLMQKNEVMKHIAISKILKGFSSVAILTLLLWLTDDLVISILALALIWTVLLISLDLRNAKKFAGLKPEFDWEKLWFILKLSLPLGIAHMLGSLNTNIPRYLLEHFANEEALGYFAAIAYLMVAGSTIIVAVGHAVTPRLSKLYTYNRSKFISLLTRLVIIGMTIGLLGFLLAYFFGESILTLIYSNEYAEYHNILLMIVVAATITYTGAFLGYGVTAARAFKIQPYVNLIWIITSLIAGFILIPMYNIEGAAYTLISSSIIQLITRIFMVFYILKK